MYLTTHNGTTILYADDSSLFFKGIDVKSVIINVKFELTKFAQWLQANKLSLNVKKCKYMIFSKSTIKNNYRPDVCINGQSIEQVKSIKFLSFMLDEHLTWTSHIKYICNK